MVLKFIIKINFRVEITIFKQFDEVQYNKECNVNRWTILEEVYRKYKYTHIILTFSLSRFTFQDVRNTNEHYG